MDIEISSDEPSFYSITINDSIVIQTTVAEDFGRHRHQRTADDSVVNEWVREIRKLYGKKKKQQTLAIGLSAEHSVNYGNGNFIYSVSKAKDDPYEILQICVGNHCLIYEPCYYKRPICKALRELLSDNNAIVFGVGMEVAAKKIEKDFGVKLSKPWDLRKLAECSEDVKQGYYGKYNLEKLAVVMLGKERELVKPARINWYNRDLNYYDRSLSLEKIKYGTVDAFLAYEMGMNFLEKGTIEAFPAYEKWQKYLSRRHNR